MRVAILSFITVLLFAGCGKDSEDPTPTFTSPDGIWTYTTPDKAISVEFELKTTDGVLGVVNGTITVSGTEGQASVVLTDVDLPAIARIRINANDAVLVLPYVITFDICTVSSNFNIISAADASYTYPWGQLKTLTGVSITRK
jgi:hypothetical protein